jgi:anti-anti-sigma regulatory factor
VTTVVVVFDGEATPATMAGFSAQVRDALAGEGVVEVVCDLGSVADADLRLVDSLARLQLLARRHGRRVRLRRTTDDLRSLLDLLGLGEVLPAGSRLEVVGQPEQGEQPGVEEEGDPGDPVA